MLSFPTPGFARMVLAVTSLIFLTHISEAQQRRQPVPSSVQRGFGGAIFTADSTCTVINKNTYAAKTDVYLTGGGKGVELPDGFYYVRVTEPGGTELGSSDGVAPVEVIDGKFAACYQLWEVVGGFGDSRNGEYKVWVCQDPEFVSCKTDNFRIGRKPTRTRTPAPTATSTRTPATSPIPTFTLTPTFSLTPTITVTPTFTQTPITPGPGDIPTATPTGTVSPVATATPVPPTTIPGTLTPTNTRTATSTPSVTTPTTTATQTFTPIIGTPGVQTVTPTATATSSPTPVISLTATATSTATPPPSPTAVGGVPTSTPTLGPGLPPGPPIPTLSFPMLLLLAVALGGIGWLMSNRS